MTLSGHLCRSVHVGYLGYGGEGGFNGLWMNAVGNYTVLLTLFAMVLFGAMDSVGDTKYIAKWFLTRKIFKGRPVVFWAVFYACVFALSAVCSPITALIILWPYLPQPHGNPRREERRPFLEIFLRRYVRSRHPVPATVPIHGRSADPLTQHSRA